MTTIVTRAGKGVALTHTEMDTNFINLNNDKIEASALTPYLTSAVAASTYETQTNATNTYATKISPNTSGVLTHSGDVLLSGTGKRITGDFSNATVVNRVSFQSNTTNGASIVGIIPNGTSTTAGIFAWNQSIPTNAQYFGASVTNTDVRFESSYSGSSSFIPMTFYTGGAERMRIDTSGNIGINTIPAVNRGALQVAPPIGGGTPQTSGSVDTNQFTILGNSNVSLRFGLYAAGDIWIQPSLISNYATNFNLTLCPNGGNVVIPAGKLSNNQAAKAWVNFDGTAAGTITPRSNLNIASVTKSTTGTYTLNITGGALSDANYAAVGSTSVVTSNGSAFAGSIQIGAPTKTTTALSVVTYQAGSAVDAAQVSVVIFGS